MVRIGLLLVVGAVSLALAAPLAGQVEPSPQPTGRLVFLLDGNRFLSVDVATGRRTVRKIRGLAGCAPQLYATGGHVVFSGVRKRRTVVLAMPASLSKPPRVLGEAHAFVPSATEGRVWLAGVDCDRRGMVGLREITVDGRVTFRSDRRVPGRWLVGAVREGLVLHAKRPLVWDPRSGRRDPVALKAVVTVRGELMAGCLKRVSCGPLTIFDASTSRVVTASPPARQRLDLAAQFSPDTAHLVAPALQGQRWSVALVDTRTGTTGIVPGSSTGKQYPYHAWTSSGWLLFRASGGRMMGYRPGEAEPVELGLRWPRRARALVGG
jgi:hypothetical protein